MTSMPALNRVAAAFIVLLVVVVPLRSAFAFEIRAFTSPSGIAFWMVEDYTVPIVTLSFEFDGGASQDPEGKAGVASMLAAMMDEGAGDRTTAELKAEIEARGIEVGFSAGRDDFSGGMRVLAAEAEPAFAILADMLLRPRFEEAQFERIRAGFIQSVERSRTRPPSIASDTMREALFAGHPYARDRGGDEESLAAITREDVVDHHRMLLARDRLIIGVVAAASPEEVGKLIDSAFAALPQTASLAPVADVEPVLGFTRHVAFQSPQTVVSLALPGLRRADSDFFAAHLMNHILGGGSFSSRLFTEIRERRGLVYGVGSDLATLRHSAYLGAGFQADPQRAGEALDVMLAQIARMAQEGPSAEELEKAKRYTIGAYAINNLDTSVSIAGVLVALQAEGLPIDYIERRVEAINAVTLDDVRRIAQRLLSADPAIVTVGPEPVLPESAAN